MEKQHQQVKSRPYYPQLDGVRAVAAVMVMAFHFLQMRNVKGLAFLGQTGVDLFFVLSGFLITTILLLSPTGDWSELKTFYLRRTFRIFPLYYFFLLLTLALAARPAWWFWVYLQNIPMALSWHVAGPAHFWSLAIEEQFYLIQPFFVLFLPRRYLLSFLWLLAALAMLSRFALVPTGVVLFYFPTCRLDGLALGGVLAVLQQRGLLEKRRALLAVLSVVSAALIVILFVRFHAQSLRWVEATRMSLISLFYAGVVGWFVASKRNAATQLMSAKPLRFVGKVSYGLYVYHPAIFAFLLLRMGARPRLLQLVASFAAAFAAACISWFGFERYFILLKEKVAPERRPLPAEASEPVSADEPLIEELVL